MEKIRLVSTPTHVNGTFLPFGACYGRIAVDRRRPHKTVDKHGKKCTSWRNFTRDIVYFCDDFRMCPGNTPAYFIRVWDNFHEVWYNTTTIKFPEIFEILDDFIVDNNLENSQVKPFITAKMSPHEKKCPQPNSAFKVRGHALNPRIITDYDADRKMRAYVVPTNHVR